MRKFFLSVIPVMIFSLLLTLGISYAQEEEPLREPDAETPVVEEIVEEEDYPILYEDYEYDYGYDEEYVYDSLEDISAEDGVAAAGLMAFWAAYGVLMIGFGIGAYVFMALALQKIGKEMNFENPWFAWIPVLDYIMVFKLGGQNPWLLLLCLIPGVGSIVVIVLYMIALANITEKRGYEKALILIVLTGIGTYILLYLLAWKPKTVQGQTQIPIEEKKE